MSKKLKNILICVAGATPQVITETIYALSTKTPPVHIEELHVITTSYGKRIIKEKLLDDGVLENLIKEYGLPSVRFSEDAILVIKDAEGNVLDDIRNHRDNESTGDLITDFIRKMSERGDTALHCSIAGGRKTMSFYLGSALQLFGRPQDRLYHVLVSPEFENNPEFFYPPKRPVKIPCRMPDGTERLISTRKAEVHLAALPFLRLKERLFLEKTSFKELIKEAQEDVNLSITHLPLTIDFVERKIVIGKTGIPLQPMKLAIYTLFAAAKTHNCRKKEKKDCQNCSSCYLTVENLQSLKTLDLLIKINQRIYGKNSSRIYDDRWLRYKNEHRGMKIDTIRQYIRKINQKIERHIENAEFYLIKRTGGYGSSAYGIKADKNRIKIILNQPPNKI